jgi:hypothetical protein
VRGCHAVPDQRPSDRALERAPRRVDPCAPLSRRGRARDSGGELVMASAGARYWSALRVVGAPCLVLAALTFGSVGCTTSDGTGAGSSDAAGPDGQCPPGVACDCTYVDGAYYNCGKDGGIPACAANAQTGAACASTAIGTLCASCSEGAGSWCSCAPVADAGAQWGCVGTEYPCKGP